LTTGRLEDSTTLRACVSSDTTVSALPSYPTFVASPVTSAAAGTGGSAPGVSGSVAAMR
jgi:hypothetical protein